MLQPFFSIGVTTYNRLDLLRQTLSSILVQSFTDFEVIIGNDYIDEPLSDILIGITDSRIRLVNHPCNLGEVGNMNALLALASGRYFTWLADDDQYEPNFLQTAFIHLTDTDLPAALFSSYRIFKGTDAPEPEIYSRCSVRMLTGSEFLDSYFTGKLRIIAVYGLFETCALRSVVGGIEKLCVSAVGLYSEYMFLVCCGLFERILYCDAPYVLSRDHAGSWGGNNSDLDKYSVAGNELVRRCGEVLSHPSLSDIRSKCLLGICKLHLDTFAGRIAVANIAQENFGPDDLLRSIKALIVEANRIRQTFIKECHSPDIRIILLFPWRCLKKYFMILGQLAFNRIQTLRAKFL